MSDREFHRKEALRKFGNLEDARDHHSWYRQDVERHLQEGNLTPEDIHTTQEIIDWLDSYQNPKKEF